MCFFWWDFFLRMGGNITMRIFLIALVVLLVTTGSVLAFGVSSPYWKDNPLEMYLADVYTVSANIVGIPALAVPTGLVKGLPYGVQFMGPHFSETTLLALGSFIEKTRGELSAPLL